MRNICILDDNTINKIAAGEVVEKPMAVVKELVENSIDAGATNITIEIKDGGTSFIRVTDNGSGIDMEDIDVAFCRHATSKIREITDLNVLNTLGFRGEALASIAAVSMVECVTKTEDAVTGINYVASGGVTKEIKEVGCPKGTTFVVRNLFYNVPARKKFLKANGTEAGYITDLVEKLCLSHPDIAFNYIQNGQQKITTRGNGKLLDVIYSVYGKDITANVVEIKSENELIKVYGFIGKPVVSRGSRNYMNCFVNGRYIKSNILYRAIEEGFGGYKMVHRFPFAVLLIEIDPDKMDVNVHPSKMEVRFSDGDTIFSHICHTIKDALRIENTIPSVSMTEDPTGFTGSKETEVKVKAPKAPEPFERKRINYEAVSRGFEPSFVKEDNAGYESSPVIKAVQDTLFDMAEMEAEEKKNYRVVGCVFATYWIVEYKDEMYIMDQHAAHEKVLFERFKAQIDSNVVHKQPLSPPIILTLSAGEADIVNRYNEHLSQAGFEIEAFGGNEYAVRTVPANLYGINSEKALMDTIMLLSSEKIMIDEDTSFTDRIATMACKAAVKGGRRISEQEAYELVDTLFTLDNPFNCPHGRPTLIKMTKQDLEKQFGRIV